MTELSKYAEEIMVEILSRLPPKSLMRLKCVRKSWQCLINNSNFQAKHLSVSKRNKHQSSLTIVFQHLVPEDIHSSKKEHLLMLFDLYHHGLDGDDDDHELHPTFEDLYTPFTTDLQSRNSNLCMYVPSSYSGTCGDGFGYDLQSKDYKFVRIIDHGQEEYKNGVRTRIVIHPPTAVVYSLLTSSWKEIKADNLITKSTMYWPLSLGSIYLNGILYWLGCERLREVHTIWSSEYSEDDDDDPLAIRGLKAGLISFDMGNEAFHVILFPHYFGDLSRCGFGVFNEAIACCPFRDIWLMEDLGGGEGSWTKYMTFEPVIPGVINRLGFFSYNEQLVVVLRTKCAIVLQEVCTNQFKLLPNDLRRPSPNYSVAFTSSIVSINGATRQLDSHDNAGHNLMGRLALLLHPHFDSSMLLLVVLPCLIPLLFVFILQSGCNFNIWVMDDSGGGN